MKIGKTKAGNLHDQIEENDQVTTELRTILIAREEENAELRKQLEDVKSLLSEKEQQLSNKTRSDHDLKLLIKWIEKLEYIITEILKSERWRVGNALGSIAQKVMCRPVVPLAQEHFEKIIHQFHTWKKNYSNRQAVQSRRKQNYYLKPLKAVGKNHVSDAAQHIKTQDTTKDISVVRNTNKRAVIEDRKNKDKKIENTIKRLRTDIFQKESYALCMWLISFCIPVQCYCTNVTPVY